MCNTSERNYKVSTRLLTHEHMVSLCGFVHVRCGARLCRLTEGYKKKQHQLRECCKKNDLCRRFEFDDSTGEQVFVTRQDPDAGCVAIQTSRRTFDAEEGWTQAVVMDSACVCFPRKSQHKECKGRETWGARCEHVKCGIGPHSVSLHRRNVDNGQIHRRCNECKSL